MTDLLDINVWLALLDEQHVHRSAALRYWTEGASELTAFCRITMLGLLRLSTQKGVLSSPLSPVDAWGVYRRYLEEPGVCFLQEPTALDEHFIAFSSRAGFGPPLWTDAYLASFAMASGARLVSFDSDFKSFPGLSFLHLTPE